MSNFGIPGGFAGGAPFHDLTVPGEPEMPADAGVPGGAPGTDATGGAPASADEAEAVIDRLGSSGPRHLDASGPTAATLRPHLTPIAANVTDAVRALAPTRIESGDPLQLARAIDDGKATIEIPLEPGKHRIRGFPVTIKPGTVMKVEVEIKDGVLVPARDARGRESGGGCKVEIEPPLDLPIISGRGIYLQGGRGEAAGKIKADLGGFFDLRIKQTQSLKLDDLLNALGDRKLGVEDDGSNPRDVGDKDGPLPKGLFDLDGVKFDVRDMTLTDGVVDTGAIRLDLAPGSKLEMAGTLREATLSGEVHLDGLGMNQGGVLVEVGAGSASFEARYTKQPDGTMSANTRISGLTATLERVETSAPQAKVGVPPDHIRLGRTEITNGTIDARVTLAPRAGSPRPQIVGIGTAASFEGEGRLEGAKLTVKDGRDDASLAIGASGFRGQVTVGDGALRLDGSLTGADLHVADLQTDDSGGAALDIHHARVAGDARVLVDTEAKSFEVTVDAKTIDIQVDDYQGAKGDTRVDLARTTITGSGTVELKKGQGIEIEGALHVKAGFDDLQVAAGQGKARVDLAAGSTVDAEVTRFVAGKNRGLELEARGSVDVGLESYDVALPGLTATGAARVEGSTELSIRPGHFLMANTDASVSVTVDDAKIAPGGKGFSLDVGEGSRLDLEVEGSTISSDATLNQVKLGRGSKLDAVLDGGQVTVKGQTLTLERGSRARFDIASLSAGGGATGPALKGKLSVDAKVSGASFDVTGLPKGVDVQVDVGDGGRARAKVEIDEVTLRSNGAFELRGVDVGVRAQTEAITGAVGTDGVAVGTLSAERVKGMSATAIAGGKAPADAGPLEPIELAKRLKSGTFEVEIPVEGTVGDSYLKSATFAPGTKVKVAVVVKDGKIDRERTKATLTQPGDAALWVTVRGVYFDDQNTLRLDLGGMKDFAVPKMEAMPLEIGAFIDRLTQPKAGGAGGASGGGAAGAKDAIQLDRLRFSVKDATIDAGRIPVPGGFIDVSDKTRLSIEGTPQAARVYGQLAVNGLQLDQGGIALKTGKGTADFAIDFKTERGQAVVETRLDRMSLDVEYAVQKRANGDYLHLGKGSVEGAKMSLAANVPLGAGGKPGKPEPGETRLDLPVFRGTIAGGRLTVKDADGAAQVEVGRSAIEGSVKIDGDKIEVDGRVTRLDVGVTGFSGSTAGGASADIEAARVQGSGAFVYSTTRGISVEADVTSVDVSANEIRGRFPPR